MRFTVLFRLAPETGFNQVLNGSRNISLGSFSSLAIFVEVGLASKLVRVALFNFTLYTEESAKCLKTLHADVFLIDIWASLWLQATLQY